MPGRRHALRLLAALPAAGTLLLIPSTLPYSLDFTCNTWVMRALAEAGLPVAGTCLRTTAMAAARAEAARQQAAA
jgi:hypothetical protein